MCAAALVDDVRSGQEQLEGDDEEDEEAHARGGGGYYCFLERKQGLVRVTKKYSGTVCD